LGLACRCALKKARRSALTKKDIVKKIADETGLTQLKTKEVVQKTFEAIIDMLIEADNHRIELRNFGVFMVRTRKPRKARNPRTGDQVAVPPKRVVVFKPGKEMAERVQDTFPNAVGAGDVRRESVAPAQPTSVSVPES
jgi:integration host factor subunit beta